MLRPFLLVSFLIALSAPTAQATVIYWTESGQVRRMTVGSVPSPVSSSNSPIGVAVDSAGQKIYWTDNPPRVPVTPVGQILTAPASGGAASFLLGALPNPGGIDV